MYLMCDFLLKKLTYAQTEPAIRFADQTCCIDVFMIVYVYRIVINANYR